MRVSITVAANLLCMCTILMCGCIKAPNIVVLDRATALEREAAGDFPKLQFELARAGTTPRPAPVTREALEEAGHPRPIVEQMETSDAERIDALLKASCIGESKEGTLVATPERCSVKEVPRVALLLERANRDRAQIWEWLRRQRPGRSLEEVRHAWREVHMRGVICGGSVQRDDGSWEPKSC